MKTKKSDIKGIALMESLLAFAILGLGLFAVGSVIHAQLAFINLNREKAIATLAAQEEIEAIRGMTFANILTLDSTFTASGFEYLNSPSGTLNIESSYGSDIKKITVTVGWSSLAGGTKQKKLVTLVTRNGINRQ